MNQSPLINIEVGVHTLPHFDGLELPKYQTGGSACMDVCAAIPDVMILYPNQCLLVETGLVLMIPHGYEAQVRSRSGLALKNKVHVLNSPGTIDSDYRGEVKVILMNSGKESFNIERGMRIAQVMVSPVPKISWVLYDKINITTRSIGGFGSTGL